MAIEIERKFLLRNEAWRADVRQTRQLAQAYLNPASALEADGQQVSMRVRIDDGKANLNLKSLAIGPARQEFEYPVPLADAEALMALCVGHPVRKKRHLLPIGPHLWEIDEFLDDNQGLIVAEIELSDPDEAFERPDWLGLEVTAQKRYYNLLLAERPYRLWNEEEKHPC